MDNVTHSLAGLLLAESVVRLRARRGGVLPSPAFRGVAAGSSMVAANLPDADLFYTGAGSDRLSYMLQHRGYTHTLVVALVGGVLVWGIASLILRRTAHDDVVMRRDNSWLLALLVVSTLSHIALDWTNSYGVHPFWPIDDRWRYGDAVFIVEPWLWIVTVPTLVATAGRIGRTVLSLVMLIGLAAAWRVDLVSRGAAIALTIGAAASIGLARLLDAGARATTAVAAWILVTLVMALGSVTARAAALASIHDSAPDAQVLDVVVSPMPANAVCTSVISVELSGDEYRVVTGRASALPVVTAASRCGNRDGAGALRSSTRRSTPAMQWDREWTAPAADLARLARASCPALAALRFIRAPIWRAVGDSATLIGDARYGGGSGGGFTDVTVRRGDRCSFPVPPWIPPRADLLSRFPAR